MSCEPTILKTALGAAAIALLLAGCGQKGPLTLPEGPAAAQRATLPQTLLPSLGGPAPVQGAGGSADPLTPASSPNTPPAPPVPARSTP